MTSEATAGGWGGGGVHVSLASSGPSYPSGRGLDTDFFLPGRSLIDQPAVPGLEAPEFSNLHVQVQEGPPQGDGESP